MKRQYLFMSMVVWPWPCDLQSKVSSTPLGYQFIKFNVYQPIRIFQKESDSVFATAHLVISNALPMEGWWADLTVAMAMVSASLGSALSTEVILIKPLARVTGAMYLVTSVATFSFSLSTVSGLINWNKEKKIFQKIMHMILG